MKKTSSTRRVNWSREELILAFNLYCKIPFGQIHNRNPRVIELANVIGRTPSAVSWKLANFSRLDPTLKQRQIKGATHGAQGELKIWEEFNGNWEQLAFESEVLFSEMMGQTDKKSSPQVEKERPEGIDKSSMVRVRMNQGFFREAVLAAYGSACCITGLRVVELLNASHIIPWRADVKNRTNPRNGLCLNALHDRAFDRGLITVTPDYLVIVSPVLKNMKRSESVSEFLLRFENTSISLPDRFIPDSRFLDYHNKQVFRVK